MKNAQQHRAETLDKVASCVWMVYCLYKALSVRSLSKKVVDRIQVLKHPAKEQHEVANDNPAILVPVQAGYQMSSNGLDTRDNFLSAFSIAF
ncbi:hypothetical protein COL5a_005406 [Colletotrichum fioriniae]|nr:hypothetical protein COL5a_005406 [Colletotrichum fioriniae]